MKAMLALFHLLFFLSLPHLGLSLNQQGLYLHTLKSSNGFFSNWNDRDPNPCLWNGIACDSLAGDVISVEISGAGLVGPFPIILCRLSSLTTLSLAENNLNSSLPEEISACRSLRSLNLAENYFSGDIPATIADIPNLRELILEGNSFSGEIPASFGKFRRLENLDLVNNLLTGVIPPVIGNITSLRFLQLGYNPFAAGELPSELGNLSNLDTMWLSHCNLVGSVPDSFGRLSRLTNLDVSNNMLSGSISVIFEMESIVQIELFNNSFSGELPTTGWSRIPTLRRLDASLNKLVGRIPAELCELPLESLNLNDNELEGSLPESIAKSPNLNELKLFNNKLNGSLPSELGKNSPLGTIDMSNNSFTGNIPASLCFKGVLEQLILIYNSFNGNIPANLGKCKSLTRIRLRGNGFSGEIPAEFWGLPHVGLLDIAENSFLGSISNTISRASNLSVLDIYSNMFTGSIPKEIGYLSKLVEFSANDNNFSGEIPATIVDLRQLGKLDLNNNRLSGEIPARIQNLKQLNELNLGKNRLSGDIPEEIGDLPALNYLDLSSNQLVGKIPSSLQNLKLNELNLSFNVLSGEIPPLYAKNIYKNSFVGNRGLCGEAVDQICIGNSSVKGRGKLWILRSMFILAGVVLLVGMGCLLWRFRNFRKMKSGVAVLKWKSFHKLGFNEFEILECINEDNVIGNGGAGKVYKVVLSNGETVAVKKLHKKLQEDGESDRYEFEAEVDTLGKIRHKNIVRLWCCCDAGECKLLVYEYMENGSLGDFLHGNKNGSLDWLTRYQIALDAAEGLSYLHHDCVPPIVHRDVKSNNILLDADFGARISDFGIAKTVVTTNKGAEPMSAIAGSCGYIAPEYAYTLRVNEKSDVYSFGVVLLELVTGKQPIDPEYGEKDLVTWVCSSMDQKGTDHVIDPTLDIAFKEHISRVLDIGLLCVSVLPINRPPMRRVVKMLQEAGAVSIYQRSKDGKLSP